MGWGSYLGKVPKIEWGAADIEYDRETFDGDVNARWDGDGWGIGEINTAPLLALGGGGKVGTFSVGSPTSGQPQLLVRRRTYYGLPAAEAIFASVLRKDTGIGGGETHLWIEVSGGPRVELDHVANGDGYGDWKRYDANGVSAGDGTAMVEMGAQVVSGTNFRDYYVDNVILGVHVESFGNALHFPGPLLGARAWPEPRPDHVRRRMHSGLEDGWPSFDGMMAGQSIGWPAVDGETAYGPVTGWDGAHGVAAFLTWARTGRVFRFWRDRDDPASTLYAYLVQPRSGRPDRTAVLTRGFQWQIRSADGAPITGY